MRSKVSNLMVVGLFVLLSGCYLSNEVSNSPEADGGSPSAVGGSPSAVGGHSSATGRSPSDDGGDPSKDIDKPFVDAGIEEVSLPGAWQGRLIFILDSEESYVLDGFRFEFSDTEVDVSFMDEKLYTYSYSINRNVNPYQLALKVKSVNGDLAPQLSEEDIRSIYVADAPLSIFRIENDELTITMPTIPVPSEFYSSPHRSPDSGVYSLTIVFELTCVR